MGSASDVGTLGVVDVIDADLRDEAQVEQLFEILDAYARGPGGQNAPLGQKARANLGRGLREHPMAFVLFVAILVLTLLQNQVLGKRVFYGD